MGGAVAIGQRVNDSTTDGVVNASAGFSESEPQDSRW